jgi:hypothetical protein
MSSDEKNHDNANPNFSFGVRELRESTAVRKSPTAAQVFEAVGENRGVDPYNTSGSFDRTRAWARVKR